jgi:hypothetical protein
MTMFTVALHERQDNSGTHYSARVILTTASSDYYQQTQCGFLRDEFPTRKAAQEAAHQWVEEMVAGPYAAR